MVTDPAAPCQGLPFSHRLRERAQTVGSWLCVGLDPDVARFPSGLGREPDDVVHFCREIIGSTRDIAACFKINFAFFEALGPDGWRALADVRQSIPASIPVIADAKRGDIGSTSAAYARAIFDVLNFDAATVSPYLGWDAVEPFGRYAGRALFVLCRTSNPGAHDFQHLSVEGMPLYLKVAHQTIEHSMSAELGLVVGATDLEALRRVRDLSQDVLILVPGTGAQGAGARSALDVGASADGHNALVTVSRDILYASSGRDYAEAARAAALGFAQELGRR